MKEILQVELDINTMQAAWLRIVSKIPQYTQINGFFIELAFKDAYALPVFEAIRSSSFCNESSLNPARFKALNSKWCVIDAGDYEDDIDAMIDALIGVFGGVK